MFEKHKKGSEKKKKKHRPVPVWCSKAAYQDKASVVAASARFLWLLHWVHEAAHCSARFVHRQMKDRNGEFDVVESPQFLCCISFYYRFIMIIILFYFVYPAAVTSEVP